MKHRKKNGNDFINVFLQEISRNKNKENTFTGR